MEKILFMLLWYVAAYFIVTAAGILHTIFNITVLHMKSMKESEGMGEGYEKTKPWHVLYNIVIFPVFAYIYYSGLTSVTWESAVLTSFIWGTITVILDLFGWVIIKHPWSLTFRQFYVEYQPWITLIYITIYASPFIALGIIKII
ncbi:hypothetical protein [Parablautia intestinalis]|jgi:hypothetical protein|nr:hypothetical protein [Parablautia intestinalis]MDE7048581.1 hypothetical protein [Lachnospiraceae bacterium]